MKLLVHTLEPKMGNNEPLWLQATSTSNHPKIDQSYNKAKLTKWSKVYRKSNEYFNDEKLVYFISLRMAEKASLVKSINREAELLRES